MSDIIEKYGKQLADLLLADNEGYCEIITEIRQMENGGYYFMTHNRITGTKYKVEIKITEI